MIDAEQEKRLSMNIEYLKYFAELAKLQHYGKAAKALNISQPGLPGHKQNLNLQYSNHPPPCKSTDPDKNRIKLDYLPLP